jgi:hypothetical protein
MQQTLTNKLAVLGATIAVAFGMTLSAFASYDELVIDIAIGEDSTAVTVKYNDVERTYSYDSSDASEVYELLVVELNEEEEFSFEPPITVADVETASGTVTELTDEEEEEEATTTTEEAVVEDEGKSKGKAIAAEAKAKAADKANFCERTSKAAGWGVAKQCVESEDYVLNDKMVEKVERFQDRSMDKFKDFGQTTDRAELQNQLQQLLLVLIELLEKQVALQQAGA